MLKEKKELLYTVTRLNYHSRVRTQDIKRNKPHKNVEELHNFVIGKISWVRYKKIWALNENMIKSYNKIKKITIDLEEDIYNAYKD